MVRSAPSKGTSRVEVTWSKSVCQAEEAAGVRSESISSSASVRV